MKATIRQMTRKGEATLPLTVRERTDQDEFFLVNLYPDHQGRAFEGMGGAATEASAHTFFAMPEDKRDDMLSLYFGGGADYRFLRVSIDSCDFSVGHYEAMSDRDDADFASFSLARDEQEIIPLIKLAQEKAGRTLPLLLSPWSPPAFMKSNGERDHGGYLLPEYRAMWAEYICRYIEGYRAHGFDVRFVTVQNEPNATQTWDSCRFDAEQERVFVRDFLSPALRNHGLNTGVYIWDHNKERVYERAKAILQPDTRDLVAGVAFHIYTGDHFEALDLLSRDFSEKTLMFSEGCMAVRGDPWLHALRYAHEYIGDMRAGTTILLDWNLYLDARGGPNHVKNFCSAPVMCDLDAGDIRVNPSHRAVALLSAVARPGARTVAVSAWHPDIEAVAFALPSGGYTIALLNRSAEALKVKCCLENNLVECDLPALSLSAIALEN